MNVYNVCFQHQPRTIKITKSLLIQLYMARFSFCLPGTSLGPRYTMLLSSTWGFDCGLCRNVSPSCCTCHKPSQASRLTNGLYTGPDLHIELPPRPLFMFPPEMLFGYPIPLPKYICMADSQLYPIHLLIPC